MSMADKLTYMKHLRVLTSEEISKRAGVPLGTVNKIFSGQTKNPAPCTLDRISQVLGMPIHYFLDDDVPTECCVAAYAGSQGFLLLSERQIAHMERYSGLAEQDQRSVDTLIDILSEPAPPTLRGPRKRLPCYEPIASGQRGAYGDGFHIKVLDAYLDPVVEQADMAVRLWDSAMAPVHLPGAVLGVKKCPAIHGQLGVFMVDHDGYARRYYERRGVRKLQALNTDMKDICLTGQNEFYCLGTVLGAIRHFDWVGRQAGRLPAGW